MYPPLMTFTSLTNSIESGVPTIPKAGLFTDMPSSTYWFSGEVVPLIDVPYVSLRAPGAASATDSKDRLAAPLPPGRDIGILRVNSDEMLVLVVLDPTSTVGARAVTVTTSA